MGVREERLYYNHANHEVIELWLNIDRESNWIPPIKYCKISTGMILNCTMDYMISLEHRYWTVQYKVGADGQIICRQGDMHI